MTFFEDSLRRTASSTSCLRVPSVELCSRAGLSGG
jgi:hypothetical protein